MYFYTAQRKPLRTHWQALKLFKELGNSKKLLPLADFSPLRSIDAEVRSYYASKDAFHIITAATALTKSHISKVISNFFLGLNSPDYPHKLFTSEEEVKSQQ